VALVLTQPDRPAGRGLEPRPSAVKQLALASGIPVAEPQTLRGPVADIERVRALAPDALVVAAYGLLLPPALLEVGRHGAFNIHASLLPRWRGAAPIQRAILAGDADTGISIMQMDTGLDTGAIVLQRPVAIDADDDAGTLHDKLAALGGAAIVDALALIERGHAVTTPQSTRGVTYAPKIGKQETRLLWSRSASELERAVRAFRPSPGAFTLLAGEALKIWRARVVAGQGAPGAVLDAGSELVVACGNDALAISELQRPGSRRLKAREFLRGHWVAPGRRFD
jgi:methionyl-tRNA formyltransferase